MENFEYFSSRLKCTLQDKMECLETVKTLYKLMILVRKNGIFAIDDVDAVDAVDTHKEKDIFLKEAVNMLLEVPQYEQLKDNLFFYLAAGDYHGKEFLNNLLIVTTMLMILENVNPAVILSTLKSKFGVEFAQTYQDEMNTEINRIKEKKPCLQSIVPEFDNLTCLTDIKIKQLLSEIETDDLAIALKGGSDKIVTFFLGKLSKTELESVKNFTELLHNIRLKDVETSQNLILDKSKGILESSGNI